MKSLPFSPFVIAIFFSLIISVILDFILSIDTGKSNKYPLSFSPSISTHYPTGVDKTGIPKLIASSIECGNPS